VHGAATGPTLLDLVPARETVHEDDRPSSAARTAISSARSP
jgi:hypothetical protein